MGFLAFSPVSEINKKKHLGSQTINVLIRIIPNESANKTGKKIWKRHYYYKIIQSFAEKQNRQKTGKITEYP